MGKNNLNTKTWLVGGGVLGVVLLGLWAFVGDKQEANTDTVISKTKWEGGSQPTAERAISAAIEAEQDRLEFEKNNNLGV